MEKEYIENKKFKFPEIYYQNQLSLSQLKKTDFIFKLELCFITLYGEKFIKIPYIKPQLRSVNSQTSSKALNRPSATKLASSLESLKKEFYYYIDYARLFRNIIVHNRYDRKDQEKELKALLSKKQYLQNIHNNYDVILEAVNWFIRQIYIDMTKK